MEQEQEYPGLAHEPRQVGWIWLVYLILFAATIPWYWPEGYRGPLVMGFPLWVLVTLLGVFALAAWTAWVIKSYWREEA